MSSQINKRVNQVLAATMAHGVGMASKVNNHANGSGREVTIRIKPNTFGPNTYNIKIELNSDNKKEDEEVTISNMIIKGNITVDFHKEGKYIMSTYPTYYKCILNNTVKRVNAISCIEKKPDE